MARVELSGAFIADLARQVEALVAAEEWMRVDRLTEDLAGLAEKVALFPDIGRELTRGPGWTLRRIGVGRLPYLVWYRFEPRGVGRVKLHRLFHSRQHTPLPKLPESG